MTKSDQNFLAAMIGDSILVAGDTIAAAIRELAAAVEKPTSCAGAKQIAGQLAQIVDAIDWLRGGEQ